MSDADTPRWHRPTGQTRHWRDRVRDYLAAVMLNVAVVSAFPSATLPARPSIVRTMSRRGTGFDPRELSGSGMVITLPLELGGQAPGTSRPSGLN